MKYEVAINKKFSYVRSYKILKTAKGNSNVVSRYVQKLLDKYLLKRQNI
ncbi:MAG: hypothetical protein M1156_01645 [Candidatus Marsarchaeota archaeon]|jgi:hypothetical protein|nr:hypothetical protein [Candidatus Marsarchaeota archaeon]